MRSAVVSDVSDSGRMALPCRLVDSDLFFAQSPADVERAKALCSGCPLRQTCLTEALNRREPWGVWGGQLVISGVVVPHKRPRGRPRKHALVASGPHNEDGTYRNGC